MAYAMSQVPGTVNGITDNDIFDQPWKYTGYKKYAWFLASDDDFLIFRRFGTLNARILLLLQDEICVAEAKLKSLDEEYSQKTAPRQHNGSFRKESVQQAERKNLLLEIKEKLKEYNEFIVNHSNIRSRPQVSAKDVQHVKNWHITNEDAIDEHEQAYLNQTDDLFQVNPRFRTPLRRLLERSTRFGWLPFFRREPQDQTYYDPKTMYYERNERLEGFVTVTICLVGLAMLVAPLWILTYVHLSAARLAIITAFIVVFLGLIQSVTIAKPFETLAATAAYSAVLMVFMQGSVA
ncbi:hypothetical protein BKA64DRAFT_330380 [Cadophora sp. MPI-SDFR-AT-0126]|nr:hypothetical protein BKA64DRAFT_330380 [Leotiomycetes sp. MPI-SDFR-AT-0126]